MNITSNITAGMTPQAARRIFGKRQSARENTLHKENKQ